MLHALLSTVDKDSADLLQRVIRETGQFVVDRVFFPHPTSYELNRALHTVSLDVAFLDVTYRGPAEAVVDQIKAVDASLPIIGFSTQTSLALAPPELAAFIELPFSAQKVTTIARDAIRASGSSSYPNITAIMPAKAGGGATTIATNVGMQLSRISGKKKVLVVECDLQSGTIAERIGASRTRSISETLESADVASTLIWPQHVFRKDDVDFLVTTRGAKKRIPAWHEYRHLLKFVAGRYDHVVLDLPDVIDDATSEVLHAASSVFLMTTPELLSLSLVSRRLADLEALQADRSRVGILVNRWERGDMSAAEISKTLNCEVAAVFPNDYRAVKSAIHDQSFVEDSSKLGKAYGAFAASLSQKPEKTSTGSRLNMFLKPFGLASDAQELRPQGRFAR